MAIDSYWLIVTPLPTDEYSANHRAFSSLYRVKIPQRNLG